jgi:hypothetical protein
MTAGCGADHPDAGMARQLDQRGTDTAAGAVNQNCLAGSHPRLAMEHLPRGDSVDHDGLHLRRVEVVGDRDQVPGVDESVGRPPAGLGSRGDSSAG